MRCYSCRHRCRGKVSLTLKEDKGSISTCDAYVSTHCGGWWVIETVVDKDYFLCRPVVTEPFRSSARLGLPQGVELPWDRIGVKKYVSQSRTVVCGTCTYVIPKIK